MGSTASKNSIKEKTRQHKLIIDKSLRLLEKKKVDVLKKESHYYKQLKNALLKNDMTLVNYLGGDVIRLRTLSHKYLKIESQLNHLHLQIDSLEYTDSLVNTLNDSCKIGSSVVDALQTKNLAKSLKNRTSLSHCINNIDQLLDAGLGVDTLRDNKEIMTDSSDMTELINQVKKEIFEEQLHSKNSTLTKTLPDKYETLYSNPSFVGNYNYSGCELNSSTILINNSKPKNHEINDKILEQRVKNLTL